MLADAGRAVTHVILIEVPEAELVQRLAGRRMCGGCGKGYHVVFNAPAREDVCDDCGGDLYQRSDDNEETVRNRLEVYRDADSSLSSGTTPAAACSGRPPVAARCRTRCSPRSSDSSGTTDRA